MSPVDKIKDFYANLSEDRLKNISDLYVDNAFFKDPFNELDSLSDIKKIFEEMFDELDNPRFVFIDEIESQDQAFLTWDFVFSRSSREFKIHGSTHIKFNEENMVTYHRDYWDAGEELLLKIPIVKSLYSIIRNKLSVK